MVSPKKHLGQHFLKEDSIAQRITEALTHHGDHTRVLEIGPGTGALTKHLLERKDITLTAIEIDAEAAAHLRITYPQLDLVEGDMLRMDLRSITDDMPFAVIGNFPYNISTQIVFRVLEHRDRCTEVVGMFQKEVADRLREGPGSRTYGITSVLTQAFYSVDQLMVVQPGSFIPPPKVKSAVIRMKRNATQHLDCDEVVFFALVKKAFNQRRKTLSNALKGFGPLPYGVPKVFAGERAEQLSVADFVTIAQACVPRLSS